MAMRLGMDPETEEIEMESVIAILVEARLLPTTHTGQEFVLKLLRASTQSAGHTAKILFSDLCALLRWAELRHKDKRKDAPQKQTGLKQSRVSRAAMLGIESWPNLTEVQTGRVQLDMENRWYVFFVIFSNFHLIFPNFFVYLKCAC